MARDPLRIALQVGLFLLFYFLTASLLGPLLLWLGRDFVGILLTALIAAAVANSLCMRIYESRGLTDAGLNWNREARRHVLVGTAAGLACAALVLTGPLLFRAASFTATKGSGANWRTLLFVPVLLMCGAAGEELLFHGYAFQILLRNFGPFATILPVGVLFAAGHYYNPNVSNLGLVNTAGFGILFGYAFLRSRDLWLPCGLHFGWNLALPLFGVNLSGLTMKVTGYEMTWKVGSLWSGGAYGPEASILTSAILLLLGLFLWRFPFRPQHAYLLEAPEEQL